MFPRHVSNETEEVDTGAQENLVLYEKRCTGELRYLEFQGNKESTLSFPKFEIANYDVTRIHVHEQKCVHFRLELS